jgi:hypothetical protein
MRITRTALSLLAAVGLFGSCAAPESATGDRLRITLFDYVSGSRFEVVSESHSDRIEYYSSVRHDASRKYQGDRIVDAMIDELVDMGFDDHANGGRAPSGGSNVVTRAFEFQRGDRVDHRLVGEGSDAAEKQSFISCTTTFLQLYSVTQAFQAVDNEAGTTVFDKEKGRT